MMTRQTKDDPAIQQVGTGKSLEEYQALGGYKDGKFSGDQHTDTVSVWIGLDESGQCYIGIAGRSYVSPATGVGYFRTCGFQEISLEDYAALKECPIFQRTR